MTSDRKALREAHAMEAAWLAKMARHEREIRAREARRIAALVGPGHCDLLAADAPPGADPRFDHTGFAPGGVI